MGQQCGQETLLQQCIQTPHQVGAFAESRLGVIFVCESSMRAPIGEPYAMSWTSTGYLKVKESASRAFLKPLAMNSVGSLSHSAVSALSHSMEGGSTDGSVMGIVMGS